MNFTGQFFKNLNHLHDIIKGLVCDSPQAMKHLFELFYKPLCLYAVRYVTNMHVAEDIVSDVMYRIWQNRHQGYQVETFREYLYSATRNSALNHLKQQQHRQAFSDEWANQLRNQLIEETPLDAMIAEENQSKLNSLIDSLPEQCRKIFLMSRLDNLSYEEIAAQLDISTNTVKYHIKTALQRLRAATDGILAWLILFGTVFLFYYSTKP